LVDNQSITSINPSNEDILMRDTTEHIVKQKVLVSKKPIIKKEKQRTLKIYTRTGDAGETSLCNGSRTFKDSLRVEAYGAVDETSSYIGLAVVKTDQQDLKYHLMQIQKDLFAVGSNLAMPSVIAQAKIGEKSDLQNKIPIITDERIKKLETWIDKYTNELPQLKKFILSGGTVVSSDLQVARSICRKAERRIVSLKRSEEIDKNVLKYMNRLSDYLFTAARLATHRHGKEDIKWIPEI
jgi:cob(I)alamin adenosyltransferase